MGIKSNYINQGNGQLSNSKKRMKKAYGNNADIQGLGFT